MSTSLVKPQVTDLSEFKGLGSATEIAKAMPTFEQQFGYSKWLEAMRAIVKTREHRIEEIETQAAMAKTLNKAIEAGDIKAERDGNGQPRYVFVRDTNTQINTGTVNSWRQVSSIRVKERREYYLEASNPSRAGLLKWAQLRTIDGEIVESEVLEATDLEIIHGDCLEVMRGMPDDSVDLVFGSPPYEDARTYGIDYDIAGEAWVDWMLERVVECLRVCKGLVAFVVEGRTQKYAWSATPVLLMAKIQAAGYTLRKPVIYQRHGTPGSGGPDWLRNDYEFVICATNGGKLPWSDNTACGTVPKWGTEGGHGVRKQDGKHVANEYKAPELVNPGNVIECLAGGGHNGHPLCHENEAPFPEKLAELFVRSFCPAGGHVLDPFCGSGTTLAVAQEFGRAGIGIDIRESQVNLAKRRISHAQRRMFA